MALAPTFKRAYWSLFIGASLYTAALLSLSIPWLQRHVLYLHKLNSAFYEDINNPAQYGFAKNQVTPFNFTTTDQEIVYAWHVMPLQLYAKHEAEILLQPPGIAADITKTKAFQLLREDPESRLIINFHGTVGHVAQGWRPDAYRSQSDGKPSSIHILAIDYRGFGLSTGSPTEEGLIIDAVAAVDWAMKIAQVPSHRIVILGHSLGTAVTAAVAEHFAKQGVDFAGVVLVQGFTSIPSLLTQYSIGGYLPLLSPFKSSPTFARILEKHTVDKWQSTVRLASFVRAARKFRLFIIHAKNDFEIPWTEAEGLFAAAANATTDGGMDPALFKSMKVRNTIDMGEGCFVATWKASSDKIIREEIIPYGHHSRVVTYASVALAILKAFGFDDGGSLPL